MEVENKDVEKLANLVVDLIKIYLDKQSENRTYKISKWFQESFEYLGFFQLLFFEKYTYSRPDLLIDDEELFEMLDSGKSVEEEDKIIIDYYTNDEFRKISDMFERWIEYPFMDKRKHIFASCLVAIKKLPPEDSSSVVIPTLFSQLTGFLEEDIYNIILNIPDVKNEIKTEKLQPVDKRCLSLILLFIVNANRMSVIPQMAIEKIFLHGDGAEKEREKRLNDIELPEYFILFRSKILHGQGDYMSYNTPLNLIRTCLYLNYVIESLNKMLKVLENNK